MWNEFWCVKLRIDRQVDIHDKCIIIMLDLNYWWGSFLVTLVMGSGSANSGFGKFPLKNSNFSFFPFGSKKISSGRVKKYPGQREDGLFYTAVKKYAWVGSGSISRWLCLAEKWNVNSNYLFLLDIKAILTDSKSWISWVTTHAFQIPFSGHIGQFENSFWDDRAFKSRDIWVICKIDLEQPPKWTKHRGSYDNGSWSLSKIKWLIAFQHNK